MQHRRRPSHQISTEIEIIDTNRDMTTSTEIEITGLPRELGSTRLAPVGAVFDGELFPRCVPSGPRPSPVAVGSADASLPAARRSFGSAIAAVRRWFR